MTVQQRAFSNDIHHIPDLNEASKVKWRDCIQEGIWKIAIGRYQGELVSVATAVIDQQEGGTGICEVCGVATLPTHRQIGAATTVMTQLLNEHFETSNYAWLAAGNEEAQSVYEKMGFRVVGTQRNLALPSAMM